jgi:hypothetical protein
MPLTKAAVAARRATDPLYNDCVKGEEAHAEGCPQWRAMVCSVPIECEHGHDVCPKCDPCTCKPKGKT